MQLCVCLYSMYIISLSKIPMFAQYYFKFGGLRGTQLHQNWWENNANFLQCSISDVN